MYRLGHIYRGIINVGLRKITKIKGGVVKKPISCRYAFPTIPLVAEVLKNIPGIQQDSSTREHLFIPSTLRIKQLRRFRNKIVLAFSYFHFRSARTLFHFLIGVATTERNEQGKKRLHLTQDYAREFPLFLRSDLSSIGLIFFLSVLLGLLGLLLLLIGGDGSLLLLLLLGLQSGRNNLNVRETVSFANVNNV